MEHYKNLLQEVSFTAIDFETANESRDSACSFGFVQVRNGQVVNKGHWLIQQFRVSPINYNVHGISIAQLIDAPTFSEVWPEIEQLLHNEIIVAHNADFDIDVLRQMCASYGYSLPEFRFLCSQKLSQEAFVDLENYRLNDVASFLDLTFNHHDCLSDAETCAQITLKALLTYSDFKFTFENQELTFHISKKASALKKTKDQSTLFSKKKFSSDLLKPNLEVENKDNFFYNKKVVFTGDLQSIARKEAAIKVQALGADINTSISKHTNLVIIGQNAGPSKMDKISTLQAAGHPIKLIDEKEFLRLLELETV